MACAPPTLKTVSTPHSSAATSTAGWARPSHAGGVHSTRVGQAVMRAGTASMITVEGRGALPAGTYRPTALRGRSSCSQRTPGSMSSASGWGNWAAWNACTLVIARSRAAICPRASERRAWANSAGATLSASSSTASKRRVRQCRASSPDCRTLAITSRATRVTSGSDCSCGRARAARRCPESSVSQSRMRMRSGEHLLDRQDEQRARAHPLQALEGLPEDVLATHRVHGDAVGGTLQRNDGRGLRARQEPADLGQCAARCVQHDVLALAHLLHAVDAHQEPLHPLVLRRGQIERGADQRRVTLPHSLLLPPSDAHQEPLYPLVLRRGQVERGAVLPAVTPQHRPALAQVIRLQRRAG